MSVKCQAIINAMEQLAPSYLAEDWDNVGLLAGSPAQEVSKVLVALDLTSGVLEQAINERIQLIITHHPFIFKPLTRLRTDCVQGSLIARLIKADMALWTAHTNLDIAVGGVSDALAKKLNLSSIQTLMTSRQEKLVKLVVFVPQTHVEQVSQALFRAGAGYIGNYSHCSFQADGRGTFLPLAGTNPYIGQQGELEQVEECRVETILPERLSKAVVEVMKAAHPYEEVAFDLYPLLNPYKSCGLGRIGSIDQSLSLAAFANQVKHLLPVSHVRVVGAPQKRIKTVAVCGGSGAELISQAKAAGCDVLITGDVKYHEAQLALAEDIAVIDAGHFATEWPVIIPVAEYLQSCSIKNNWQVEVVCDRNSHDIFSMY